MENWMTVDENFKGSDNIGVEIESGLMSFTIEYFTVYKGKDGKKTIMVQPVIKPEGSEKTLWCSSMCIVDTKGNSIDWQRSKFDELLKLLDIKKFTVSPANILLKNGNKVFDTIPELSNKQMSGWVQVVYEYDESKGEWDRSYEIIKFMQNGFTFKELNEKITDRKFLSKLQKNYGDKWVYRGIKYDSMPEFSSIVDSDGTNAAKGDDLPF